MLTIKKRVTEYEYTCVTFIQFGVPEVKVITSYEPLKLRDIYREYETRRVLKPTVNCNVSIKTYEVTIEDFVKLAKQKTIN